MIGYGEVCPLGPFYLPAYAEGVRAGLKELGPHLAHSTPEEFRFTSTVFNSYVSVSNASSAGTIQPTMLLPCSALRERHQSFTTS